MSAMAGTGTGLAAGDLDYVRGLVHAEAAIMLDASKGYLVEARLLSLAREAGLASVSDLVKRLRTSTRTPLHARAVESLTTNETSWFRDVHPYAVLEKHVLPDLIDRRASSRTLTIWSAACSSGQEPYSIAMILRDRFPELATWRLQILATDISPQMVERARAGRFSQMEINRGLPAPSLVRWFERDGLDWVAKPELRAMLDCRVMNLAGSWGAIARPDVVFLRNVLIYFSVETKRDILNRLLQHIPADGALFLGAAESTLGIHDGYERVAPPATTASYYRPRGA